jgi:hypothetical protein
MCLHLFSPKAAFSVLAFSWCSNQVHKILRWPKFANGRGGRSIKVNSTAGGLRSETHVYVTQVLGAQKQGITISTPAGNNLLEKEMGIYRASVFDVIGHYFCYPPLLRVTRAPLL